MWGRMPETVDQRVLEGTARRLKSVLLSAPSDAEGWLTPVVLLQYLCTVFPTSHNLGDQH